ncbi:NHLP leader peptide family natural product precursor [Paenibacillus sambharensis]|uniref:NHLP leader peptide family natural product n=1 Tax=Paenibacillus sambharensis TaxID=1803190 RepID=A0A2W1LIM7_9BACL|nr:NHLP leader peptide family RiPP precursor [Paenibacillus sambharensis]PZD94424.1 NHLP leader peptide family natural product precursor [Paenibacillus sambharensis]
MTAVAIQSEIIQKAWSDPSFKQKLLTDPVAAVKEAFGIQFPESVKITAVEESADNVYLVIPPSPAKLNDGKSGANAVW